CSAPEFYPVGGSVPLERTGVGDLAELQAGRVYLVPDMTTGNPSGVGRALAQYGMRGYFRVPLMVRGELIGSVNIGFDRPDAFTAEDVDLVREVAQPLAVGMEQARLHEDVLSSQSRLQGISRRMVEIEATERAHLARELHDEIGQLLTGLKLSLENVERSPAELAGPELV